MMQKTIVVCSGLPFSGKSYLMRQLTAHEELQPHTTLTLDTVFRRLFGDRADGDVTKTEHLYKNRVLREDLLREVVLGTALYIFVELVMLTRRGHQEPFMETVREANTLSAAIAKEKGASYSDVQTKVILCYTSTEEIVRRATATGDRALSPIDSLSGARNAYEQFEFPDPSCYTPYYLDTATKDLTEVRAFIKGKVGAKQSLPHATRYREEILDIMGKN